MVVAGYYPDSAQQWKKDSLEGWEKFLKDWPIEKLVNMKIEDYVLGTDRKTFCYGLEYETKVYAPIPGLGGISRYGVHYDKDHKKFVVSGNLNLEPEDAFEKIRSFILKIASAAQAHHVDVIQRIIGLHVKERLISPQIIWKIALLYQPINEPYLLAVCALTNPKKYWPGIKSLQQMQERFELERRGQEYWDFSFNLIYKSMFSLSGASLPKVDSADKNTNNVKSHYVEEILDTLKKKKNVIIEGAPGTGKTFITREVVVRLCDNEQGDLSQNEIDQRYEELVQQGRVSLTTFHPALDYEDFVEGYKPTDTKNKDNPSCPEFTLRDGIFKSICDKADKKGLGISEDSSKSDVDLISDTAKVWKVSLMQSGDNPVRRDCLENGRIRIGWDDFGEDASEIYQMPTSSKVRQAIHNFQEVMRKGDIVISCYSATEADAIGVVTGDYEWVPAFSKKEGYCRARGVKWLYKGRVPISQEINEEYKLSLSAVYQLKRCSVAKIRDLLKRLNSSKKEIGQDHSQAYVLIIDEINRGNIPKVFGELITLLENDKRGILQAKLPYSLKPFSIPKNLYILGTMNTADRSIGGIDYALRRRFAFVRMRPEKLVLSGFDEKLFDAVCKLFVKDPEADVWEANREYLSEEFLPEDVCPGHSYFIMSNSMDRSFRFKYEILPLLEEYVRDGVLKSSAIEKVRDIINIENE